MVSAIRIFLLGSTAAIFAVSGAIAAGAVVADPEPVEYVRVCDAYGAGYFFIPGTETCMRISGYVRVELKGGDNPGSMLRGGVDRDTYAWITRMVMNFHSATETELGTLRTFMQLRSQWRRGAEFSGTYKTQNGVGNWVASSADTTQLRFAYIELGGLRVGLDESIFSHWTGYNGAVLNDDVVNPMLYSRTNVISYTYNAGNGFSAILGLEQGNDDLPNPTGKVGYRAYRNANGQLVYESHDLSAKTDDYTPNVVGGLKYVQGWGSVSGVVAYDAYYEEWAGKMRLNLNVTDQWSVWVMGGYKSADDNYDKDFTYGEDGAVKYINSNKQIGTRYGVYRLVNSIYGDWGGDWSVWGGTTYKFNPKTSFNAQASFDDSSTFAASIDVRHELVPGLLVAPELTYVSWNNDNKLTNGADTTQYVNSLKGKHAVQGMIRLQRSF